MIKMGFIVEGPEEIEWYGCEIPLAEKEKLIDEYGAESDIEILLACDDHFSGPRIEDPADLPGSGLVVRYCLPDEEDCEAVGGDRLVDLGRARTALRHPRRKKCPEGHVYLCGGESKQGYRDFRHYDTGFLPPFKPEDVVVFIDDLSDYGYDGYVLSEITYATKSASYVEGSLAAGKRLGSRILED